MPTRIEVSAQELLHYQGLRRQFEAALPATNPAPGRGRGIVTCGGGQRYFPCLWVLIHELRRLGCRLPIELWHFESEMPPPLQRILAPLDVSFVNADAFRRIAPHPNLRGWELKPYALLHSRFAEALFLDADNVPVLDPTFLFDSQEFRGAGTVFWPDQHQLAADRLIWSICEVSHRPEPEFETGQILIDRNRHHRELALTNHFNEHSGFYYAFIHGDKETFHMAWRRLHTPYAMVSRSVHIHDRLVFLQFGFDGDLLFQHRNFAKWVLPAAANRRIEGFLHEMHCLEHLHRLEDLLRGYPIPATRYTTQGYTLR